MAKKNLNKSLSRQSWINAAFKMLKKEGINQVRVERLARILKVTKGSFYWHFKNRKDLLQGLLDYWANEMTQSVLTTAAMFHGDPKERIYITLKDIVGKERAAYDPVVRAWANHDPFAKKAVEKIDKLRIKFLTSLFQEAGFDKKEADIRARLMYYYVIGEVFVTIREPMSIRIANLKKKAQILTS